MQAGPARSQTLRACGLPPLSSAARHRTPGLSQDHDKERSWSSEQVMMSFTPTTEWATSRG
jgi:hypothetical protein